MVRQTLLTIEDFRQIATEKKGVCLSNKYEGPKIKLLFECANKHLFEAYPTHVKYRNSWCRKCYFITITDDIKELQKLALNKGGRFISSDYRGATEKHTWECNLGHQWEALPSSIKRGHWCPLCQDSLYERLCRSFFQRLFNTPFPKKRPSWLINDKGNRLELDGYSEELKLAFEHQGPHHYDEHFYNDKRQFSDVVKADECKRNICKERGINLIEIPCLKAKLPIKDFKSFIKANLLQLGINIPSSFDEIEVFRDEIYNTDFSSMLKTNNIALFERDQKLHALCMICNYEWKTNIKNLKRNVGCLLCKAKANGLKRRQKQALTIENIIRANDGKLMTAYEHSTIQLQIMCKVGHVFYISSKKVKKGDWCEECCKDENEPS